MAGFCELIAACFKIIVILCIYRQPSGSDVTAIDSLTSFTAAYQLPMIIMGDFNVHHQEWFTRTHTSTAGRSLLEFCEQNGLSQLVTESTLLNHSIGV